MTKCKQRLRCLNKQLVAPNTKIYQDCSIKPWMLENGSIPLIVQPNDDYFNKVAFNVCPGNLLQITVQNVYIACH